MTNNLPFPITECSNINNIVYLIAVRMQSLGKIIMSPPFLSRTNTFCFCVTISGENKIQIEVTKSRESLKGELEVYKSKGSRGIFFSSLTFFFKVYVTSTVPFAQLRVKVDIVRD